MKTGTEYQKINVEVFFSIVLKVSYPAEVKMKPIEMRAAIILVKQIMDKLNKGSKLQLTTWMKRCKNGEMQRFYQSAVKQYPLDKGRQYD